MALCPQCGFDLESRTHLEGLGGIHAPQPDEADTFIASTDAAFLLTKAELLALAKEKGIAVKPAMNKAEIIEALNN